MAGVVYADKALAALKDYCIRHGGIIHENSTADPCKLRNDFIVQCCGPWSAEAPVFKGLLQSARVYCHWFRYTGKVPLANKIFLIHGQDGRLLYGMPTGEQEVKIGWHSYPMIPMEPGHSESLSPEKYVTDIRDAFSATTGCDFNHIKSQGCYYTNTPDENYIVDQISANHWAIAGLSGHGFKFAPALAYNVVASIKRQENQRVLGPFSLRRFQLGNAMTSRTQIGEQDIT